MKTLCLDFDGVIHSYTSGWKGADQIPDPPVPGAIGFIYMATKSFKVAIYSSRSHQPGGLAAMMEWLNHWAHKIHPPGDMSWLDEIAWPMEKPAAFVTLDDRALNFTGIWPAIEDLLAFKPWYQL